ncbi:putative Beige protein 1 [Paratrimastix pyriformis]|uniref:Beige protein 1 n=1 Tax=Paratrimastix pyriformis TaxID=342808 RepID=A0ABQ8UAM1_9EUKA|nr:putative Beige protein 1 [Paratrimastix pyriformis]
MVPPSPVGFLGGDRQQRGAPLSALDGCAACEQRGCLHRNDPRTLAEQGCEGLAPFQQHIELRSVTYIASRRYTLQPVALEVFTVTGETHFMIFTTKERRDSVFAHLCEACKEVNGGHSVEEQPEAGPECAGTGFPWRIVKQKHMTEAWVNGQISNFQYLMYLNTLAGRTVADLNQYPVFPWVLCDYASPVLDLSDPKVYRDLSRPMGAMVESRTRAAEERYNSWQDETIPPFHHGSHYSNTGVVLHYLIRMPPFSALAIHLQGGKFDTPDRMFHSVGEAWQSAAVSASGDVKELIPEFFYLPDFLRNGAGLTLGRRTRPAFDSRGVPSTIVNDVVLPPWAHRDPEQFVRIHRQALESPFVSAHLHEWIDLIFGYKQRGPAAVAARNIFYYLTYDNTVDLNAISDPVMRKATIAQINNFGQIPRQLFFKEHPKRTVFARPTPICVHPEMAEVSAKVDVPFPISDMRLNPDNTSSIYDIYQTGAGFIILVVGPSRQLIDPFAPQPHTQHPCGGPLTILAVGPSRQLMPQPAHRTASTLALSFGHPDQTLRLCQADTDRCLSVHEHLSGGAITCVALYGGGLLLRS